VAVEGIEQVRSVSVVEIGPIPNTGEPSGVLPETTLEEKP